MTDTREVDGIANTPTDQYSFNVREFDELAGLAEQIFGGNGGGAGCSKFLMFILILCNACHN